MQWLKAIRRKDCMMDNRSYKFATWDGTKQIINERALFFLVHTFEIAAGILSLLGVPVYEEK